MLGYCEPVGRLDLDDPLEISVSYHDLLATAGQSSLLPARLEPMVEEEQGQEEEEILHFQ